MNYTPPGWRFNTPTATDWCRSEERLGARSRGVLDDMRHPPSPTVTSIWGVSSASASSSGGIERSVKTPTPATLLAASDGTSPVARERIAKLAF